MMITQTQSPLGCTTKTKRCPMRNWVRYDGKKIMPPCCRKHLRETIIYATQLFEEMNIMYWIDFGTLLGAVREGQPIIWDSDADFGVLLRDRKRIAQLKQRIADDGFCLGGWGNHNDPTVTRFCRSETNHMWIDLFYWYRTKGGMMKSDFSLNMPKSFPDYFIRQMKRVKICDHEVWAPRDTEKFLEFRFGPDWQVPQNKKVHGKKAEHHHKKMIAYARSKWWSPNRSIRLL